MNGTIWSDRTLTRIDPVGICLCKSAPLFDEASVLGMV